MFSWGWTHYRTNVSVSAHAKFQAVDTSGGHKQSGRGGEFCSPPVVPAYASTNIGTGAPSPSVARNFTFTFMPHFSASRSHSMMLVSMIGPSSSFT